MNRDKFTEQELLEARERNNKSRKYKNDTLWKSNSYDSFTIIGKLNEKSLYIQFVDTNAIYIRQISAICSRQVKDVYVANVYNKGFFGEGEYSNVSHKDIYDRWHAMLQRVYSGKYPSYSDCEINEDWHNFQHFARDIEQSMEEKGIDSLKGYAIDKDIKSKDVKIYSKDTISIVTPTENTQEMVDRVYNTVYIAKNINTGDTTEFTNQRQFAREHNINSSSISAVLKGKAWSVGGFTFYKKGDKAPDIRICVYVAENVKTGETFEFTNQRQFAKENGICISSISRVLKGKAKTAGGFTFRRKEE